MSVFVVDASVAVKWMLPEPLAREAVRLQSPKHQLHAPSILDIEPANVLWKKVRQALLSRAQADVLLGQMGHFAVTLPFLEQQTTENGPSL